MEIKLNATRTPSSRSSFPVLLPTFYLIVVDERNAKEKRADNEFSVLFLFRGTDAIRNNGLVRKDKVRMTVGKTRGSQISTTVVIGDIRRMTTLVFFVGDDLLVFLRNKYRTTLLPLYPEHSRKKQIILSIYLARSSRSR